MKKLEQNTTAPSSIAEALDTALSAAEGQHVNSGPTTVATAVATPAEPVVPSPASIDNPAPRAHSALKMRIEGFKTFSKYLRVMVWATMKRWALAAAMLCIAGLVGAFTIAKMSSPANTTFVDTKNVDASWWQTYKYNRDKHPEITTTNDWWHGTTTVTKKTTNGTLVYTTGANGAVWKPVK